MPDRRKHRGAHPKDAELFAPGRIAALRSAVADLSWLLGHGYAPPSSVKIVGDRYGLTARQRTAVQRCACSDAARESRLAKRVDPADLTGADVVVDGYNLLITIEAALAGGVILIGRDTTARDLASIHGSYRTMAETIPALELIGQRFAALAVGSVHWLLDAPVSNSGRLARRIADLAAERGWPWTAELLHNPDAALIASGRIVVSSDSVVLDGCLRWANVARHVVAADVPRAWTIRLGNSEAGARKGDRRPV